MGNQTIPGKNPQTTAGSECHISPVPMQITSTNSIPAPGLDKDAEMRRKVDTRTEYLSSIKLKLS